MEHYYENIHGWAHFTPFYKNIIDNAKDGYHFVEVGSWKGRSAAFMGVEILNSNKKIKFDCIDTWMGSSEHLDPNHWAYEEGLSKLDWLYNLFLSNIEPVKDYVNPIRATSEEASKLYEDGSLDFVFIDAAHDYDNVCNDIRVWLPKVRKGGILAGDDIQLGNDVDTAVKHMLGKDFTEYGYSVWYKKV